MNLQQLMAFRVRKFHSLLLGIVGLCLVVYSSYFSTSGLIYVDNAVAGIEVGSAPYSLLPSNEVLQAGRNSQYHMSFKVTPEREKESILSISPMKTPSTVLIPTKEKIGFTAIMVHADSSNTVISTPTSQVIDLTVVSENTTTNTTINQFTLHAIPHNMLAPVDTHKVVDSRETPSNTASDSVGKAILTRVIFEPGFEVPNAEFCPNLGRNVQLLVLITSAPTHKEARMAIRHTWGSFGHRKDINIAFLLGSVEDPLKKQLLDTEGDIYGDLIRSHFLDTYNNLTLKSISMLEWVAKYCSQARFILKTDDDMFINIPKLLSFIEKHTTSKRVIFGRLAKRWKPIRNKKSKYYVSLDQYRPSVFPDFTTGPAYLLTSDIVNDMYNISLNKTYLKLEDVFLTGIVAQEMKVKRIHVNEFFNKRISLNACSILKGISIHMVKFHEQFDLWKKLLDGKAKCN